MSPLNKLSNFPKLLPLILVLCAFAYGFPKHWSDSVDVEAPEPPRQSRSFFDLASKFLNPDTVDKMKNLTSSMKDAMSAAAQVGAVVANDVKAQMKDKASDKIKSLKEKYLSDDTVNALKEKALGLADKADSYISAGKQAMDVMKNKVKGDAAGKEGEEGEDKGKEEEGKAKEKEEER